jgi:hypothetical protein
VAANVVIPPEVMVLLKDLVREALRDAREERKLETDLDSLSLRDANEEARDVADEKKLLTRASTEPPLIAAKTPQEYREGLITLNRYHATTTDPEYSNRMTTFEVIRVLTTHH